MIDNLLNLAFFWQVENFIVIKVAYEDKEC